MPVEKVETQEAAVAGAQEQKPSESAASNRSTSAGEQRATSGNLAGFDADIAAGLGL